MQIDAHIIYIFVTVMLALQGWILVELINLKISNATQTTEINNMKTHLANAQLLIAALALALVTGCATGSANPLATVRTKLADAIAPPKATVVTVTNLVQQVVTNQITVYRTNDLTAQVNTYLVPVYQTNVIPILNNQTNITYVEQPLIAKAQAADSIAGPFIPPPYNAPIEVGLGLLASFSAWLAAKRNNQAKGLAADNADLGKTIGAVVKGVEKFSATLPDSKLKTTIADFAQTAGVADTLHASVVANT